MTDLDTAASLAAPANIAESVSPLLEPVVIDLQGLAINLKQMHWNVRGSGFIGVHELLDRVVDDMVGFADLAAERVVALGTPVDARLGTIADESNLPVMTPGFRSTAETIAAAVGQLDAAISSVRAAIESLDSHDPASQDVAVEIERGLVKDRWLLEAHNNQ